MRVAIDQAQGDMDWSGEIAVTEEDLMEAFELIEDARVDLWN